MIFSILMNKPYDDNDFKNVLIEASSEHHLYSFLLDQIKLSIQGKPVCSSLIHELVNWIRYNNIEEELEYWEKNSNKIPVVTEEEIGEITPEILQEIIEYTNSDIHYYGRRCGVAYEIWDKEYSAKIVVQSVEVIKSSGPDISGLVSTF